MTRTDVISLASKQRPQKGRIPSWAKSVGMVLSYVVLAFWAIIIVFPGLAPYAPETQVGAAFMPPDATHWLGTDELGRDTLSRTLSAAKISIPNGILIVVATATIGTVIGLLAGFFGGWVDEVLMRLTDLVFAFPGIILAMAIAAALGPSIHNAVIAGAVSFWPAYARATRSIVLSLREAEFVLSNRLSGVGPFRSILVDLLPAVIGSVLVLAMLEVGSAILFLAGLSFLGLGAVPPAAEWGSMISIATDYFDEWWLAVAPGIAIVSVVIAFNVIGDAIRDHIDPQSSVTGGGSE